MFKGLTAIQTIHAPYKGIAPALVDVMSGRVTYTFDTGVTIHVESGKLRPLAVATSRRIAALANVPTFEEAGIKGMQMNVWFGIAGTANMPRSAVNRVGTAVNVALCKGELPQRLQKLGSDSQPGTPESFNEFWQSEVTRYAEIVRLSGARLD